MGLKTFLGQGPLLFPLWPGYTGAGFANTTALTGSTHKLAFCGRVFTPSRGAKNIRSVAFRFGAVTKAGGSALTLSLQDIATAAGPMQPDGTADQTVAIGNAAITANTWYQTNNLSADRAVSFGDYLAIVLEYDGAGRLGADSIAASYLPHNGRHFSSVTVNTTGAWSVNSQFPPILLAFSDGTFGGFFDAAPVSAATTQTFSAASSPDEYALEFSVSHPCTIDGGEVFAGCDASSLADFDVVLYDAGTNVLASESIDVSRLYQATSTPRPLPFVFPAVNLLPGNSYALAVKPTTNNLSSITYFDVSSAGHFQAWPGATTIGTKTRTDAGAWSALNTTRRILISPRLCAISDSIGGLSRSRTVEVN